MQWCLLINYINIIATIELDNIIFLDKYKEVLN